MSRKHKEKFALEQDCIDKEMVPMPAKVALALKEMSRRERRKLLRKVAKVTEPKRKF